MRSRSFPAWPLALALCASTAAAQTTWYVDVTGTPPGSGTASDPFTAIQLALSNEAAVNGDTIRVAPGTYVENIDYLNKSVTVESSHGPHQTTIVAASSSTNTVRNSIGFDSVLRGFTVTGNSGPPAIHTAWSRGIRVEHCIVTGNSQGLENNYDMWVRNCNVVGNGAGLGHYGGGHGADSLTYIDDTVFWDNGSNFFGFGFDDWNFYLNHSLTSTDPLFFAEDDHHLTAASPCINAGDPNEIDPDGSRLDIGALPWDPNYPLGTTFCEPTYNSTGNRATIHLSGSASVSANDLVLSAARTPANQSGIFYYGSDQAYIPFGDGFSCLTTDIARLPVVSTGATGTPSFALDLTDLPAHVPAIVAGEGRGFQFWFRDPFGAGGGFNYTNAVWVEFVP